MLRPKHILVVLLVVVCLVMAPMAQDKEKIKKLTPTHKGSTGLFNLYTADTLRQGEFSVGINAHKFNRDPGDLDFTIFPVSLTFGLVDRVEVFVSYEAYKRVNADGIIVNKINPNGLLRPRGALRVVNPDTYAVLGQFNRYFPPSVLENGQIGFYNDAPFMDVGFGDGSGDVWAGLKFNILSERRGNAFGLAVQPIGRFHTTDNRQHMLRGLTSGASDYGIDGILSKNLSGGATLTGNVGFMLADDYNGIDRQNRVNYGVGVEVPFGDQTPIHFIGELVGSKFYCTKLEQINNVRILQNPVSPLDAYAGLRVFPTDWMAVSGALNVYLRDWDATGLSGTDKLGFYGQVALQRKINEPPTVQCSAEDTTITEGDTTTIRATAYDPDDDSLAITWKSSGGRLAQQNTSATFDSTGLEAGRYTVNTEVSDGDNIATCSTDITVEKRRMPPTISCSPGSASVTMGESATLSASASDPNGDSLTYSWTVDGQQVTNNRSTFEFGTAGRSAGRHTVRVTATDVDNMSASCEFTVSVNERPNNSPTCSLSLNNTEVFAGETVTATARASDPDNDPLNYAWKVDGQNRSGSGNTLTINTGGMAGGSHSVALTVTDDRGATCTDTQSFSVTEKIAIQVDNRVDNQAKAQLDEVALKLQQNPQLRVRLTGHTDDRGGEEANQRVGMRRANQVKEYLMSQHNIAENRIETESAGESSPIADNSTEEGRNQNRRVEVELYVP